MENDFVILHGYIRSIWGALQRGQYYFATDGRITYYTITEQPVKQIDTDIEATELDIGLSPAGHY